MINFNKNSQSLYRWLFRNQEDLDQVVFLFISKKNATNARFLPLFLSSSNIRIVYLLGNSVRYLDKILMYIGKKLFIFGIKKSRFYEMIHVFDFNLKSSIKVQIVHIDDPQYSDSEIKKAILWQSDLITKGQKPILIVTNAYTRNWFIEHLGKTEIIIIEQGFHRLDRDKVLTKKIGETFICAYSSNFIHYGSDRHANDSTWGSSHLFDQVIPKIQLLDPTIKFHLIGELGKEAELKTQCYNNVVAHGRVSFEKNMQLLMQCDIAIYPRLFDHKRSVLKIFSYIGADLPIVTIDLVDTEIVKRKKLGFAVKDMDSLIKKILELRNSNALVTSYKGNILKVKDEFTWKNLATKMESELQKHVP